MQIGGGRYEFGDTCAIIINPNKAQLQKAIRALIANKQLYEALSAKTLLRSKELEWQNIAQKIQEVIKSAIT